MLLINLISEIFIWRGWYFW